jgi:hypothetical protein
MLALNFRCEDYVFVYSRGQAVGAIRVGAMKPGRPRSRVTLLFAGGECDFQIMRPKAVLGQYGREELERLIDRFALTDSRGAPCRVLCDAADLPRAGGAPGV